MIAVTPRRRALALTWAFTLVALASQSGCNLLMPPESRVKSGELFEVAHTKYDPYFVEVHALQKDVASWEPQKQAARRPLVDVLKIDPDVADVSLVQATHERILGIAREAGAIKVEVSDGRVRVVAQNPPKVDDAGKSVFAAIESCAKSEMDRAKTLRDIPAKADALVKQGRALEPQVKEDLQRRGSRFPKQVQEELHASYEALTEISKSARLRAREAEDFVADLRRAVESDLAESAARPGASASAKPNGAKRPKPSESKPGDMPPKPAEAAKPVEVPKPKPAAAPVEAAKPVEAPKPAKPAEAPKPKDEFNP